MFDHGIGRDAAPGLASRLRLQMREDVRAGWIEPQKEWLLRGGFAVHEIHRTGQRLLIDRFHALARQRPGVDGLAAGD